MTMPARITSVDGLRGLLALYVMIFHYCNWIKLEWPLPTPGIAVAIFFLMSGYVLTPTWKGDYREFLIRRFLRLWPLYALVLAICIPLFGTIVTLGDFVCYPIFPGYSLMHGDGPVWSLRVEMWAMVIFPAIVWAGKTLPRTVAAFVLATVANYVV